MDLDTGIHSKRSDGDVAGTELLHGNCAEPDTPSARKPPASRRCDMSSARRGYGRFGFAGRLRNRSNATIDRFALATTIGSFEFAMSLLRCRTAVSSEIHGLTSEWASLRSGGPCTSRKLTPSFSNSQCFVVNTSE